MQLSVFTNHQNLTFCTLNAQRVLCCRMYMQISSLPSTTFTGTTNLLLFFLKTSPDGQAFGGEESGVNKTSFICLCMSTNAQEDEFYSCEKEVLLSPPSKEKFNTIMKCKFSCCRDGESHFLMKDEIVDAFLHLSSSSSIRNNAQPYNHA